MRRRGVSSPLSAALLALSILLAGLPATPTIGAGASGALAAKKKNRTKPAPIRGTLSKRGYTLIALDRSGVAKTRRIKGHKFKLRPPAERVTLHLRAPNGTYAGPIVLRGRSGKARKSAARGKAAIVGVKAGARLGKVRIRPGAGYAIAKVAGRWLDGKRRATARRGVPIGAGNFGRVRVKKLRGPTDDRDRDGIPNSLDIDDDGDLVLDDIDANDRGVAGASKRVDASDKGVAGASAAQASEVDFTPITYVNVGGSDPGAIVNANAPGVSEGQIQSALRANGQLLLFTFAGFDGRQDTELNCGTLIYCSAGGIGRRDRGVNQPLLDPNPEPFPACCDSDGDGLGSFPAGTGGRGSGPGGLALQPGADADQIRGGDLLIAQGTDFEGQRIDVPATLQSVLATPAAIASYTDELGVTHQVPYPYTYAPLPVVDGPDADADVSVTFNFWRPQRRPIPDELPAGAGNWIDIGGLHYWAQATGGPSTSFCPQGSYAEADPNLAPGTATMGSSTGPIQIPVLTDSAPDRAASPANTFSYTLDLSQCLAARGQSFSLGETRSLGYWAAAPAADQGPSSGASNQTFSTFSFIHQP
jgi:hypothetical protein